MKEKKIKPDDVKNFIKIILFIILIFIKINFCISILKCILFLVWNST